MEIHVLLLQFCIQIPEILVVGPEDIVGQLVQQRVDHAVVRAEPLEVVGTDAEGDALAEVLVPSQHVHIGVLGASALLLVVINGIHLAERADLPRALRHDVDDTRVRRKAPQQLFGVVGSRRGVLHQRLKPRETILGMLLRAPVRLRKLLGSLPSPLLVPRLICEALHKRVSPSFPDLLHLRTRGREHHQLAVRAHPVALQGHPLLQALSLVDQLHVLPLEGGDLLDEIKHTVHGGGRMDGHRVLLALVGHLHHK
mmetsp:Transcript_18238/g.40311  ORF Transcript_18238/g.40311 Transcript_18238/m.40311 type:complete len:255 (-) Transcript_18238:77-841(-)